MYVIDLPLEKLRYNCLYMYRSKDFKLNDVVVKIRIFKGTHWHRACDFYGSNKIYK